MATYEVARFTDEAGRLDRLFPSFGYCQVPAVLQLDAPNDRLLWEWDTPTKTSHFAALPSDVLTRFLLLGDPNSTSFTPPGSEEIFAFAKEWGPLNVWEVRAEEEAFRNQLPSPWAFGEPLEFWREYWRAMHGLLGLAAAVREGQTPDRSLFDLVGAVRHTESNETKALIASTLNSWLDAGNVAPALRWYPDAAIAPSADPEAVIAAGGLFGSVVFQLVQVIAGVEAWQRCKWCGIPFPLESRKRGRRPRYCRACGTHARWRKNSRAYYRRNHGQETR